MVIVAIKNSLEQFTSNKDVGSINIVVNIAILMQEKKSMDDLDANLDNTLERYGCSEVFQKSL